MFGISHRDHGGNDIFTSHRLELAAAIIQCRAAGLDIIHKHDCPTGDVDGLGSHGLTDIDRALRGDDACLRGCVADAFEQRHDRQVQTTPDTISDELGLVVTTLPSAIPVHGDGADDGLFVITDRLLKVW